MLTILADYYFISFLVFRLYSSQLQTTVALDYDLATSGIDQYVLLVSVNDTENVDFVQVTVMVQDINDNDPVFANDSYRFATMWNKNVFKVDYQ